MKKDKENNRIISNGSLVKKLVACFGLALACGGGGAILGPVLFPDSDPQEQQRAKLLGVAFLAVATGLGAAGMKARKNGAQLAQAQALIAHQKAALRKKDLLVAQRTDNVGKLCVAVQERDARILALEQQLGQAGGQDTNETDVAVPPGYWKVAKGSNALN